MIGKTCSHLSHNTSTNHPTTRPMELHQILYVNQMMSKEEANCSLVPETFTGSKLIRNELIFYTI